MSVKFDQTRKPSIVSDARLTTAVDALRYIAGYDVGPHQRSEDVAREALEALEKTDEVPPSLRDLHASYRRLQSMRDKLIEWGVPPRELLQPARPDGDVGGEGDTVSTIEEAPKRLWCKCPHGHRFAVPSNGEGEEPECPARYCPSCGTTIRQTTQKAEAE